MVEQSAGDDLAGPIVEFLDRALPVQAPGGARRRRMGRGPARRTDRPGPGRAHRGPADAGLGVPLAQLSGLASLVGERLVPGPLIEQLVLPALLPAGVAGARLAALADPAVTVHWAGDLGGIRLSSGTAAGTVERSASVRRPTCSSSPPMATPTIPLSSCFPQPTPQCRSRRCPATTRAGYARVTVAGRSVAPREVVATGAAATALMMRIRAWMRLLTACELAGIARRVLADSVAYAEQREQFGRPVGSVQALKHILATMAQLSLSLDALSEAAVTGGGPGRRRAGAHGAGGQGLGRAELAAGLRGRAASAPRDRVHHRVRPALVPAPGAVVGMPDPVLVERVCAYVVSASAARVELADLVASLRSHRIANRKPPERLEIVFELPRTPTGKIQKFRLREETARRVAPASSSGTGPPPPTAG